MFSLFLGSTKVTTLRTASYENCRKLQYRFGNFPYGGKLCSSHKKNISFPSDNVTEDVPGQKLEAIDEEYVDSEYNRECCKNKLDQLFVFLGLAEIPYKLDRKIKECKSDTVRFAKRKLKQLRDAADKVFLEGFMQLDDNLNDLGDFMEDEDRLCDQIKEEFETYQNCPNGL